MSSDGRLLQALLRNDFRAFVEKVFMTLTPGQTFNRSWHIEAIAHQLERVRRGEIKRLIINMPPRSLKSIMASLSRHSYSDSTLRVASFAPAILESSLKSIPTTSAPYSTLGGTDRPFLEPELAPSRTMRPKLNLRRGVSGWRRRSVAH
jgi:hypothetical protein